MVRLSIHRISEGKRKQRQLLASTSLTHSVYVYITLSPSIYTSPSSIPDDLESVSNSIIHSVGLTLYTIIFSPSQAERYEK